MLRLTFLAALAIAALAGCFNVGWSGSTVEGSGVSGSRTVDVSGIDGVRLAVPGVLVVTPGAAPLRIEGDDNVVEALVVDVDGGVLTLRAPRGESFQTDLDLRMTVGADRLESLDIAGSGRIEADGVRSETVAVSIGGSGDVSMMGLEAASLEVSVAGSGGVVVGGTAERVSVDIAGSGDVDAGALAAADVEVAVAGSGDVTVRAAKSLDVSVMGSGDVRYYGSPEVSQSIMGSGDVVRAGDGPGRR
ncbi:head GIN domain-containing protein [Rubrivirga sp. IMCC43871]|uniref:head GIN domain-containing protein n=1 Tax=Rubrivirga sp. IMCC43871 TaxID=3391575 RepID=UPI00398FEDCA